MNEPEDPVIEEEREEKEVDKKFTGSFMGRDARLKRVGQLGDKYKIPINWAEKLPVSERKITDIFCLILFLIVVVIMIGSTIYILSSTEHQSLYKMYDSSGNDCGIGNAANYPLLFMQTFEKPYKSVCVKECPSFDYNQIKYNSTGTLNRPVKSGENSDYSRTYLKASTKLGFILFNEQNAGKSKTHTINMTYKEIFGYDSGFANNYYSEQNWEDYLKNTQKLDCFPNDQFSKCEYKNNEFWVYDSYPVLGLVCAPLSPKTALNFYKISSKINHGIIGDILETKVLFVYCGLISLTLSLIFLVITRYCAKIIIWILGVLLGISLIVTGIGIFITYFYQGSLFDKANYLKIKYLSFLTKNKIFFMISAVILILLGGLVFYLLYKRRKQISEALSLLEVAAKATLKNTLLIILSFVIVVCQIFVLLIEIYIMLRLFTMGTEKSTNKVDGSPFIFYDLGFGCYFLFSWHIFGTIWIVIFLNNFNDFINTAVTVNYYFETRLNNFNILCHAITHNAGSIAWTIVLLPTLIIQLIFWPFKWCFTSEDPTNLQNIVNSKCHSCCVCYEFFIDSICENFMALTYMGSEGFLVATRRYFFLTQKYLEEHQTITFLSLFYNLLARSSITILSGYCGILIYKNNIDFQQNVKYVGVIFAICFFVSFIMGTLFINLFSTAYDTIIICYLTEFNLHEQKDSQYVIQANEYIKEALKGVINPKGQSYMRLLDK